LGQHLTLTASDGHMLGAYRADPAGTAKGGIVVIQEIFGVNNHIRNVTDRFAAEGYVAIAPALFDRQQRDFQSGYTPDEVTNARKFIANPDWDAMLRDTQAAIDAIKSAGPIAVVGFCMGGSIAFLAATRLSGLTAAVGFYGGAIAKNADEQPKVPVQLHFGALDQGIPLSDVEVIRQKRPEIGVNIYDDAGHGFNCDERSAYHKPSADLAWPRMRDFLTRHLQK
jgi:carboxymethylenebutenolidase